MTDAEKTTMLTNMTGETDSSVLSTYLSLAEGVVIRRRSPLGTVRKKCPQSMTVPRLRLRLIC